MIEGFLFEFGQIPWVMRNDWNECSRVICDWVWVSFDFFWWDFIPSCHFSDPLFNSEKSDSFGLKYRTFASILVQLHRPLLWAAAMILLIQWSSRSISSIWTKFGSRICRIAQLVNHFQMSNFPLTFVESNARWILWATNRLSLNVWPCTTVSSHFTLMFQSSGGKQRIDKSDSIKLYERRVVLRNGSINTVTPCTLNGSQILRVWIPDSIVFLKWYRSKLEFEFGKERHALKFILFELNSRLTWIESEAFSSSSLQSILIPKNVEILESKCFEYCHSLLSIAFESNSRLTRIESEVFHFYHLNQLSFRGMFDSSMVLHLSVWIYHQSQLNQGLKSLLVDPYRNKWLISKLPHIFRYKWVISI
jgi:hypothetical protein